ncbi:hypothetical protein OC844_007949 [Tilletia horrida]|nr:hypothetical protein OC844_007949 [Tilletia horrida]
MNADEDPALQFFPDGKVDLYGVLGVEEKATEDEVKKAYRRLALRYHPDKVLSLNKTTNGGGSSSTSDAPTTAEDASRRFQQLGFAYAVLSNAARRERYDRSGRTDELGLGEDGEEFDWNEYFKTVWTGEVTGKTLDEFKKKYQGSDEEVEDIRDAYEETDGSFAKLFEYVPCSEVLVDSQRFIDIVEQEISAGKLKRTKEWDRSSKDKSGRAALEKKARAEASEAEEYAKELGIWDDLFGSKSGKSAKKKEGAKKRASAADAEEADEVDADGNVVAAGEDDEDIEQENDRSKVSSGGKTKAKKGADGKKAKGKKAAASEEADDDDADLEGLKALMAKRNSERQNAFGSMLARMEAKARSDTAREGGKRKKGSARVQPEDSAGVGELAGTAEPTDEEFAALQAKMFGDKAAGGSSNGKGSAGGSSSKRRKTSK